MDTEICKQGILTKAGKHSFQAWRKRWFNLNSNCIKYYTPGTEYTDVNMLGVIEISEIKSITTLKSTKNGFEIALRNRTYNLSAKSDVEREDWILAIQKACDQKRASSVLDGTSPIEGSNSTKKEKNKKKEKKTSKSRSSFYCESTGNKPGVDPTTAVETDKPRSNTIASIIDNNSTNESAEIEPKKRSLSLDDTLENKPIFKMVRKMSRDEISSSYEDYYTDLNEQLDNETSDDDDDDCGAEQTNVCLSEFVLPPPLESNSKYAFLELKELINCDKNVDIDLTGIYEKYGIAKDDNSDEAYVHINLLKCVLEKTLSEL